MKKKTIKDIKGISGKTVFLTVDFNISLNNGRIANDTRIKEALPTINYLFQKKAKIILASHLGRPKGHDPKFSLAPVAKRLKELTKKQVHLIDKFWETSSLSKIASAKESGLVLLENIRFHPGEQKNDRELAKHYAAMADFFVNDAFGASHRVHASIVGIAEFLPAYAGLLLDKEIRMLSEATENPKRPFVLIIGGAKTPEKISVIEKLLDSADSILLGGAIANTFLAAWGFGMGHSMVDYEMIEMARVVFWKAACKHTALILPLDLVISDQERKKPPKVIDFNKVPSNVSIYDIGPKTCEEYQKIIRQAKTVIWNGPMGLYEDKRFQNGTNYILQSLSETKCLSIIGGGDTLTSVASDKYLKNISHVSTGGSAMLEFLQNGTLPGIEVLLNA